MTAFAKHFIAPFGLNWAALLCIRFLFLQNAVLFGVLALVLAASLALDFSRRQLWIAVWALVLGTCGEYACCRAGMWVYAHPRALGLPLWLPLVWPIVMLNFISMGRFVDDVLKQHFVAAPLIHIILVCAVLVYALWAFWILRNFVAVILGLFLLGAALWGRRLIHAIVFVMVAAGGFGGEYVLVRAGVWKYAKPLFTDIGMPVSLPLAWGISTLIVFMAAEASGRTFSGKQAGPCMKVGVFCALLCALSCFAPYVAYAGGRLVTREQILSQRSVPVHGFRIKARYPHDPRAFTQGLAWGKGSFYESTGRWGMSSLRKVEKSSGRVLVERRLASRYFGEGASLCKGRVVQLTYKSHTGFVYDLENLAPVSSFAFSFEGWGLTWDGSRLIASDGTENLYFLDPESMKPISVLAVRDNMGPIAMLNELEWAEGRILANLWTTDIIACINPQTGRVTDWIDLSGLNPEPETLGFPYVLNGIAFNPENKKLFVTGKCWPQLFEIELVPPLAVSVKH